MVKASIIGHLGKDALVKEISGKMVINFSVAHTESFKNSEGVKIEKTIWVECAYWSEKTSIAPYLKKGTQVYVEGQPSADAYTNNEGKAVSSLRLRVSQIQLLSSNRNEQSQSQPQQKTQPVQAVSNDDPDDLPF